MAKDIDFYFDFGSPTAWLAWNRLSAIAQRYDAKIIYRPVLLGAVHKATGNTTPALVPAKGKYMIADLARFAKRHQVPLTFNKHFPIMTLPLMRGAIAAQQMGCFQAYSNAVFTAIWVDSKDMNDPAVIGEVITTAGLDAAALLAATQDPAIKQALIDSSEEGVARGIFGVPTMFVDDQMFFGQDRLDFVEEALQG